MTWTTSKPSVPGWYWWRQQAGAVLAVVEIVAGVRYPLYGGRYFKPKGGEWAGPILQPEE